MADDQYDSSMTEDERRAAEKARNDAYNAEAVRAAANVAQASGHPVAKAIGTAFNAADKATGGWVGDKAGQITTGANKVVPGGRAAQGLTNELGKKGLLDKAGTAASMKNGGKDGKAAEKAAEKAQKAEKAKKAKDKADQAKRNAENTRKAAEEQKKAQEAAENAKNAKGKNPDDKSKKSKNEAKDELKNKGEQKSSPSSDEEGKEKKGIVGFLLKNALLSSILLFLPFILFFLIIVVVVASVLGLIGNFEDAFGMSSYLGDENGNIIFNESSSNQKDFFDRIDEMKYTFQSEGKDFDHMRIIALYNTLKSHGADLDYDKVTNSVIREWGEYMLNDGVYNELVFKENMINAIFPKYLPNEDKDKYSSIAEEVDNYLNNYYNLIGKTFNGSNCSSIGSCAYDIRGFYIPNKGNVLKKLSVSDLKVRLMQCGSPYGNGSYTTPIDQPLVNFEDYVAGVAYAEIGSSASLEAYKAQMVVARSFALSRPTAMGNNYGKKLSQENGQWILQISSCVADQVFCDIDKGCSIMGGGEQGGYVVSGHVAGAERTKPALSEDHIIRQALSETQGEVLVNAQGYIIATSYASNDQKKWIQLAKEGLNYKQILIQHYNQGKRNYGAKDIVQNSCNTDGSTSCISTGEFSTWKQRSPEWSATPMGNSGKNLGQIGCLATSVSMLLAKSGVQLDPSINPLNPGTFVQFLNTHGGIDNNGNYQWYVASQAAPSFKYQGMIDLSGMNREAKLNKIKEIVSQKGVYAVAEVLGNTGQHWVAIDSVTGSTINIMDPSTNATDMWAEYNWANTSAIAYYRVG